MVADGAAILAELDTELLKKLYEREIRISVSNLDLPPSLPGFLKEGVKGAVDAAVAPKFDMDLEMMAIVGKPGNAAGLTEALQEREKPSGRLALAELVREGGFEPR